jgi:cytosine/adenosine deaminase-related metal-dependent hydrolase
MDHDAVQAASSAGGLEGLCAGTTAVFDLHSSSRCVADSLSRVARGLSDVGLRAVLTYAVSDRDGPEARAAGLHEAVRFMKSAKGRMRGAIGAHDVAELSGDALTALREALRDTGGLFHLHLAEDPTEEKRCRAHFDATPVERLKAAELLGERTLLAQGVHLSWPELSEVLGMGTWMVHCPRSNMASQTGTAAAAKFGVHGCLGTDTQPLDALSEAQAAWLRSRDAGQPIDVLRYLANGHRLLSLAFGQNAGPLRIGALADLVIYDYRPPTPLTAQSLAHHVVNGLSSRQVESVMVDGMWRLWARKPLGVKADAVAGAAREAAQRVWATMAEPPVLDAAVVEAENSDQPSAISPQPPGARPHG